MDLAFLFNNALDALKDGGRVKVASRLARPPEVKGDAIVVEVTDTWTGNSSCHIAQGFDLFVTTKQQGKETGLRLAVCQEIAKDHGVLSRLPVS
jgi:C4-dicarboxylate-specific signal transduction histidine kinase